MLNCIGKRKSWYIIFLLFLPLIASSQCDVSSIIFGDTTACNQYGLPVTVNYTGTPLHINISAEGLAYPFGDQQYFHRMGDNITFVIYPLPTSQEQTINVTATLTGGTCNDDTKTVPYKYQQPAYCNSNCLDQLTLTGSVTNQQEQIFEAKEELITSQVIKNTTAEMRAFTVTLEAGFSYESATGKTLYIHTEGCEN